jgi:hypothetical protein
MQAIAIRIVSLLALLGAAALTTGCATRPSALYGWDAYQPQVYVYLKDEDVDYGAQIAKLEDMAQKMRASGKQLPPGYHAHLGMLYAKVGKDDQVRQQLETEKARFPESGSFVDFLMRSFSKKEGS